MEFGNEVECIKEQIVLTVEKSGYSKQYVMYNEMTSNYVRCDPGIQEFNFQLIKWIRGRVDHKFLDKG